MSSIGYTNHGIVNATGMKVSSFKYPISSHNLGRKRFKFVSEVHYIEAYKALVPLWPH
jgi:hypothetical protein